MHTKCTKFSKLHRQTASVHRQAPQTHSHTHTLLLPVCVPPQIELYAERYANNNQRKDADDAMMLLLLLLERPRQNHGHGNKIKRSTKKQYTIIKTKTPGTNLPPLSFPQHSGKPLAKSSASAKREFCAIWYFPGDSSTAWLLFVFRLSPVRKSGVLETGNENNQTARMHGKTTPSHPCGERHPDA